MTYFWAGVYVLLAVGVGLIVWGALSGPGRSGHDVSARRTTESQIGAVLVGVSLCALLIAYFTARWP